MEDNNAKYKRAWEYAIAWLKNQDPTKSSPKEMEIEKWMLNLMLNISKMFELETTKEDKNGNNQS